MFDGDKAGGGAAADALCRRIGGDEVGIFRLELLELLHERVEFGVRYLGVVESVITLFVVANELAKCGDSFRGVHESNTVADDEPQRHRGTEESLPKKSLCLCVSVACDREPSSLTISRQHVIGQIHQRLALSTGGKKLQRFFCALDEIGGNPAGGIEPA